MVLKHINVRCILFYCRLKAEDSSGSGEEETNENRQEMRDSPPRPPPVRFLSHIIFAYAKTKVQISCVVTAQLISTFVFDL